MKRQALIKTVPIVTAEQNFIVQGKKNQTLYPM